MNDGSSSQGNMKWHVIHVLAYGRIHVRFVWSYFFTVFGFQLARFQ